jgi:hypothetical protein
LGTGALKVYHLPNVLSSGFQARSKFFKIRPSRAKFQQRKSKKKAWISLDSLVRIERFQWVAATPPGKKNLSPLLPPPRALASPGRAGIGDVDIIPEFLIFARESRQIAIPTGLEVAKGV